MSLVSSLVKMEFIAEWFKSTEPNACDGDPYQVLQELAPLGFRPIRLQSSGNAHTMWAPSSALFERGSFLLKPEARRRMLVTIRKLSKSGIRNVELFIGRSDPHHFERAQFLEHHIPIQVSGSTINIGTVNGSDGLTFQVQQNRRRRKVPSLRIVS